MNAEITKEAFMLLCNGAILLKVDEHEHYRRETFKVYGCYLFVVENYLSNETQYYIQDINS